MGPLKVPEKGGSKVGLQTRETDVAAMWTLMAYRAWLLFRPCFLKGEMEHRPTVPECLGLSSQGKRVPGWIRKMLGRKEPSLGVRRHREWELPMGQAKASLRVSQEA